MAEAAPAPQEIRIDALDADTMALWRTVAKVAQALDDDRMRWSLVGGLMVALYAAESGQIARPTVDIDILGDARQRPSGTEWVTARLQEDLGASRHEISGLDTEKGFRFEVDGQIVDVLAPEGLGRPAMTDGQLRTIQIPGGSQALRRTEIIVIVVDEQRVRVRRPTLLGAILLKARSLLVHSRPEDQRQDLITLLGLMTDPRAATETLTPAERRWLRTAHTALNLGDRKLDATVDPARLRIARAAWRRLIA
jgi:hypothetical protein